MGGRAGARAGGQEISILHAPHKSHSGRPLTRSLAGGARGVSHSDLVAFLSSWDHGRGREGRQTRTADSDRDASPIADDTSIIYAHPPISISFLPSLTSIFARLEDCEESRKIAQ